MSVFRMSPYVNHFTQGMNVTDVLHDIDMHAFYT